MKIKNQFLFVIILSFSYSLIACSDDSDSVDDGFAVSYYAESGITHQSASIHDDYLFFVSGGRRVISLYNMKTKTLLCSKNLKGGDGNVYHSNQTSFGVDYYSSDDYFPLIYISQRSNEEGRCFTEVFRIIPSRDDNSIDISSFDAKLVQTIYYPVMSETNSLGNVNTVIDQESRLMYTYSRNNNKKDNNYGTCKISCFEIPDIHQKEVNLEDEDIIDSYILPCSAINMQGGCIKNGKLYIGQGSFSVGYILLNVVDLVHRQLEKQVDMLQHGFREEPEGCFWYDDNLMISTINGNIWRIEGIFPNKKQN